MSVLNRVKNWLELRITSKKISVEDLREDYLFSSECQDDRQILFLQLPLPVPAQTSTHVHLCLHTKYSHTCLHNTHNNKSYIWDYSQRSSSENCMEISHDWWCNDTSSHNPELYNRAQASVTPQSIQCLRFPDHLRGGTGSALHFSCSLHNSSQVLRLLLPNPEQLGSARLLCAPLECTGQRETFTPETIYASQCFSQLILIWSSSLFTQYLCIYAMAAKTESCQDTDEMITFINMM